MLGAEAKGGLGGKKRGGCFGRAHRLPVGKGVLCNKPKKMSFIRGRSHEMLKEVFVQQRATQHNEEGRKAAVFGGKGGEGVHVEKKTADSMFGGGGAKKRELKAN